MKSCHRITHYALCVQDRAELAKKEKQEREDRKMAKKYGNCANGDR